MRLVFMGTPEFARACLEKLHSDGFDIAAVYTKIDTPKNRGMKLIPSPVKEYAQSVEILPQSLFYYIRSLLLLRTDMTQWVQKERSVGNANRSLFY